MMKTTSLTVAWLSCMLLSLSSALAFSSRRFLSTLSRQKQVTSILSSNPTWRSYRGRMGSIIPGVASASTSSESTSLPTVQQLSSDPFMKQVSHADVLVQMLQQQQEEEEKVDGTTLLDMLKVQLSHSDGIRGFMVTYLAAAASDKDDDNKEPHPADQETVPPLLMKALLEVLIYNDEKTNDVSDAATTTSNNNDLISLACMNVIMPTAMITMHQEATLSEQSRQTAERGIRLLRSLFIHPDTPEASRKEIQDTGRAILAVARDGDDASFIPESSIQYWNQFFTKWGYQEQQKQDIAIAMERVLAAE